MGRKPITRANPYTPTRGADAGQTFASERQYRNAVARQKGFPSWYAQQRAARPPFTSGARARIHPSEQAARHKAFEVVHRMRRDTNLTLPEAARREHTTPNAVLRHVAPALGRGKRGRYIAKATDRLSRRVPLPTPGGLDWFDVPDFRSASRVGAYWNAVERRLDGDRDALRAFEGRYIETTDGQRIYFVTDTDTLKQLAREGQLHFEGPLSG